MLAAAAIGLVLVRTLSTFRENTSIAASIQVLSVTDPLTHLWNRRRLTSDLEDVLGDGAGDPHVLVLYDLNGFKRFNDLFGHPAGDALLARLAAKLADVVGPAGTCYRLGGDEFCVLARVPEGELEAFLDATEGRAQRGRGRVRGDHGARLRLSPGGGERSRTRHAHRRPAPLCAQASQPDRAGSAARRPAPGALRARARPAPTRQQRRRAQPRTSAAASSSTTRRCERSSSAAQLHDIGKLAIPDAILDKPAPLSPQELDFVRRHTIIGERILNAAPALSQVGAIVRATHEAFDGSGYPDGLAGVEIPLAARIIAVCDTYSAITSDRPYQAGRSHDEALTELRAVAGSQLDPELVELFCATVGDPGRGARFSRPAA